MSNDRYERIRAALEMEPTPGPWYVAECRYGFAVYASKTDDLVVKTEDAEGRYGAIDNEADACLITSCDPDTIRALLKERDALARENEALKRCAVKYLEWLGVTHMPLDQALRDDMRNPSMCGDAALSKEQA